MWHILITPTYHCSVSCFVVLFTMYLTIGLVVFFKASELSDLQIRYDDICQGEQLCIFNYTMNVTLVRPKIYYRLENFYANHRKFVKSRSYKQLRGQQLDLSEIDKKCTPILTVHDLGQLPEVYDYLPPESDSETAYPCGLIAKYKFNDTFKIVENESRKTVQIVESDITSSVDHAHKFQSSALWQPWTDILDGTYMS